MLAIQNYYRKLDNLRRVAGASNEGALQQAFYSLLEAMAQEYQLIVYTQYAFKASGGASLRADGVVMDRLRLVHGWWEAKDAKDDLDKEIAAKLAQGYPKDNIIFEDTHTAVLWQDGQETLRCLVNEKEPFERLLACFFNYELPEVENFRSARAKFLTELPQVSVALRDLLTQAHQENYPFHQQAKTFLTLCQGSMGAQVKKEHLDEMLIQHILTDQIFRSVFPESRFHQENHLAIAISELENCFFRGQTRQALLKRLAPYFATIRQAAANTVTSGEKQNFLKQVYEDFYTAYNPKEADKLGMVYTPQEAVRFMIEGCDWLTQKHFAKRLLDKGLDILDPCMGTGTFIVDLLDYWRGDDHKALAWKFRHEIHANEISILPYYIACLNIEQYYYEMMDKWVEFKGACWVNTLENWGFDLAHEGANLDLFGGITHENQIRIQTQNKQAIPVILGNPPYNANQKNENDNNKNDRTPVVDQRIKDTYLQASTAQKTKLYDPYIRFFRWASDRLGDEGVLAFITNRSYLDSKQADGLRKIFAKEFQEIWLVDLMSDVRKNPKISGTKHNIFGIQTGVAIAFLVRTQTDIQKIDCNIHYLSLDDFLPAVEKRRWLTAHHLPSLAKAGAFQKIKPDVKGTWLNQVQENWTHLLPIASKKVKAGRDDKAIFKLFSLGVVTARDEWVYDHSKFQVEKKTQALIRHYQTEQARWGEIIETPADIEKFVNRDIKWTTELTAHLVKGTPLIYQNKLITRCLYRPFIEKFLYYDKIIVHRLYQQNRIFPIGKAVKNLVICFTFHAQLEYPSIQVTKKLWDYGYGARDSTGLPLYTYTTDGKRHDNISDWALKQFQQHCPTKIIKKRDIFNYIYAILHDPRYLKKYALNLKAEFPRIPLHPHFKTWATIGAKLIKLHADFEQVKPYDKIERVDLKNDKTLPQCRLKAHKKQQSIEIDSNTALKNIPASAWDYQLGNRCALEWVLDQYKEKKPKNLTLCEKFNHYHFADHKEEVIELLMKVCQISVETLKLIKEIESLPWD